MMYMTGRIYSKCMGRRQTQHITAVHPREISQKVYKPSGMSRVMDEELSWWCPRHPKGYVHKSPVCARLNISVTRTNLTLFVVILAMWRQLQGQPPRFLLKLESDCGWRWRLDDWEWLVQLRRVKLHQRNRTVRWRLRYLSRCLTRRCSRVDHMLFTSINMIILLRDTFIRVLLLYMR